MSEFDILFPIPQGGRNADDMGMPPNEQPKRPPYPEHCLQPELCAGKGYCPRDPTCVD